MEIKAIESEPKMLKLSLEQQPSTIFYKDEGGKANYLTASCLVSLADNHLNGNLINLNSSPNQVNGNLKATSRSKSLNLSSGDEENKKNNIPIGNLKLSPRLVYESGGEVEDEEEIFNVLGVEPKTVTSTNEVFTVKFRIEKVSRRKDGKKFRVRFDFNDKKSNLLNYVGTETLAPVQTNAVTVLSKRKGLHAQSQSQSISQHQSPVSTGIIPTASVPIPRKVSLTIAPDQTHNIGVDHGFGMEKPLTALEAAERLEKARKRALMPGGERPARTRSSTRLATMDPNKRFKKESSIPTVTSSSVGAASVGDRKERINSETGINPTEMVSLPVGFLMKLKENMLILEKRIHTLQERVSTLETAELMRSRSSANLLSRAGISMSRVPNSLMFDEQMQIAASSNNDSGTKFDELYNNASVESSGHPLSVEASGQPSSAPIPVVSSNAKPNGKSARSSNGNNSHSMRMATGGPFQHLGVGQMPIKRNASSTAELFDFLSSSHLMN